MLTRIMKSRDDRDAGFTLIELLVVVAIIGILAAIAIPVFLSQRSAARDASVKSDLNGIAKVMETQYVTTNAYPTNIAGLTAGSPKISPGNVVVVHVAASGATAYTIEGCNIESGKTFTYDSAGGGLKADPATSTVCSPTTPGITVGT
jgi:prepilin-type N-terminal cleavage/methylation domain-containing protein